MIDRMTLKSGDAFIATDRIGRVSFWKLIKQQDDSHYLLEAIGDTLRKYEKAYLAEKKTQGRCGKKTADFCRIEVSSVWFSRRKIEIIQQN